VASVAWSTDQILRRLLPLGTEDEWRDPSGAIVLAEVHLDPAWIGHKVGELAELSGARVALISRFGKGMLPNRETVLQEGDLLHALFESTRREQVERTFATAPGKTTS
jgi:trk system potassium uptake protein TrkA